MRKTAFFVIDFKNNSLTRKLTSQFALNLMLTPCTVHYYIVTSCNAINVTNDKTKVLVPIFGMNIKLLSFQKCASCTAINVQNN